MFNLLSENTFNEICNLSIEDEYNDSPLTIINNITKIILKYPEIGTGVKFLYNLSDDAISEIISIIQLKKNIHLFVNQQI